MCRYAKSLYKPHYACFNCRKTFKRKLILDITWGDETDIKAKCPQCGGLMANMGKDFAAPRKDDIKKWEHIERLYSVDITFHSCGCSGPGYIPTNKNELILYFQNLLQQYDDHLAFWRERKESQHVSNEDWDIVGQVPSERRIKNDKISNEAAKDYWFERIKQVEQKLEFIKS